MKNYWLNQFYQGKISPNFELSIEGEGSTNDSGGAGGGSGGSDNGNQNGTGGDDGNKEENPFDGIFGADDANVGLDDFQFEEEPKLGADGKPIPNNTDDDLESTAVMDGVKAQLGAISFKDTDIPADFDPNNRQHIVNLMSTAQKNAAVATLGMVGPVLIHALNKQSAQLRSEMNSTVKKTNTQSKMMDAFNGMGFTDPADVGIAKQIFSRALKSNKNDPNLAAKATRTAMKAMGRSSNPSPNGGSGSQASNQVKTGQAALDSIFEGF